MKILLTVFCAGLLAAAAFGQERFVKPVDEASQDASFLAFRTKLIAAAERRDIRYVIGILDPKVELSFGGHVGVKGFRQLWKNEAEFWEEFLPVIKNGGRFTGEGKARKTMFSAPYTYTDFPEDLDAFEYFSMFGSDVNLRKSPSIDSEIVAKLSYNIVKLHNPEPLKDNERPEWFSVITLGGQTGYVNRKYFRSPIDYRAGFEKKRGVWKMIYFIAGD